jgi:hypothetical protein
MIALAMAVCLMLNLFVADSVYADESVFAETSPDPSGGKITPHEPVGRSGIVVDRPKSPAKTDESWFATYKWWLLAGLVVIAGGAAAAGGGGGGGGGGPAGDASVSVGW